MNHSPGVSQPSPTDAATSEVADTRIARTHMRFYGYPPLRKGERLKAAQPDGQSAGTLPLPPHPALTMGSSPSPHPSPLGRGRSCLCAESESAHSLSPRGACGSLSLRERARVRENRISDLAARAKVSEPTNSMSPPAQRQDSSIDHEISLILCFCHGVAVAAIRNWAAEGRRLRAHPTSF